MPSLSRPQHRSTGFTIIEMLVIISIIVLLLAILLPALAGARRNAQKNRCLSNMENVGTAMSSYLSNNNNVFPAGSGAGDQASHDLFGNNYGVGLAADDRPLNAYLKDAYEVAQCPLDAGTELGGAMMADRAWEVYGSSYWFPATNASGIWAIPNARLSQVRFPGQKIISADLVININLDSLERRNQWHNGKDPLQVSAAFADGHAEFKFRKTGADATANPANIEDLTNNTNGYY